MKNLAVDSDQATLDLVAHFLGIATHDNINSAPSATKPNVTKVLLDLEIGQLTKRLPNIGTLVLKSNLA